jgi:hypothetical protein
VADPAFPDVPTDRLRDGGWELVDESVETVFELPTARVEGATKVYDAAETREAVRDAVGLDHQWRFFFRDRTDVYATTSTGYRTGDDSADSPF